MEQSINSEESKRNETLKSLNEFYEFNEAIKGLPHDLAMKAKLVRVLRKLHKKMDTGVSAHELLDSLFYSIYDTVPFDRIGIALVENNGQDLRLRWVKSMINPRDVDVGFTQPVHNSLLEDVITKGRPQIINDLRDYLSTHPDIASADSLLSEEMYSVMMCPLKIYGHIVGAAIFSKAESYIYESRDSEIFSEISDDLSLIVLKALHSHSA